MNKQRINEIISSPGRLQYSSDLNVVNELIRSFPYFSTPYLMLSKMLHDENSIHFDKNLKISAAYIGNREILYNYIHEMSQPAISKVAESQPVYNIQETLITGNEPDNEGSAKIAPIGFNEKEPGHVPAIENKTDEPYHVKSSGSPVSGLLQYPMSDYFGQYYKKNQKPNEAKETHTSIVEEPRDTLSGQKSFSGWLDTLESRAKKSVTAKMDSQVKGSPDINTLIDKFIRSEPKIRPQQLKMYKPEDMAKLSVVEDHNIATETLASIYLKQGLKTRALEIFQQLILKFPEKSDYFAGRIKEIQSEGNF